MAFRNAPALCLSAIMLLFVPSTVMAQRDAPGKSVTYSDLYDFTGAPDGYSPLATLVEDASGNLFGTTFEGGNAGNGCTSSGCGIIFELSPAGQGAWTETVLYSFAGGTSDGCTPFHGVILDKLGNLYGSAAACGAHDSGTVYELSPGNNGTWTETTLYNFAGVAKKDGLGPYATLLMDHTGRLYGTTYVGGSGSCRFNGKQAGCGTVFALTPSRGGVWKEHVLYSFAGGSGDGANPEEGVTEDSGGNLFGLTKFGGPSSQGTLYELSPAGHGAWTETVLHTFPGSLDDGTYPAGIPALDKHGNLFGATTVGGNLELGALWEASPAKNGSWSEKVLYSFGEGGSNDAMSAYAGVILDSKGNLYGTTVEGGGGCEGFGCGTVYKWDRNTGMLKVLFAFANTSANSPESALLMGASGNLFGTAAFGGDVNGPNCQGVLPGCGSVYELAK